MGTLGSGNHYLELQEVSEIFDQSTAADFGISAGDIIVSIHCGSRGLGHQIGTEFLKTMVLRAPGHGIKLPDRELACAPLHSQTGKEYLGAMRAGINCEFPDLPAAFRETGQPVLIGGSMGTASHILAGETGAESLSFSSACHGAGRAMSRRKAFKTWKGCVGAPLAFCPSNFDPKKSSFQA